MSSTINLILKVNVVGGPGVSVSKAITVEAYDKIDVTVAAEDSDKVVEIQPGASSQVQMLLIKPSEYGETDPTKGLSYKVHDAAATPIVLDHDQLYLGQGQVGLLGTQIDKLLFTNNLAKNVTIEILVGRDATP